MIEEISVYLSLNGTIRDPASYGDRFGSRMVSSLIVFKSMQVTFLVHEYDFFHFTTPPSELCPPQEN